MRRPYMGRNMKNADFKIHTASMKKFERATEGLQKLAKMSEREILDKVAETFLISARTSSKLSKGKKRKVKEAGNKRYKVYPSRKKGTVARYTSKKSASDLPKHVRYKLNRGVGRESWRQISRILDLKNGKSHGEDVEKVAAQYVTARRKLFPFAVITFSNGVQQVAWDKSILSKAFGKAARKLNYEFNQLAKEMENKL